jgi:hypothetical protein
VAEPIFEMDAGPVPAPSNQKAVEISTDITEELSALSGKLEEEVSREQRLLKDFEQFRERRTKIEERLRKRERGWLEIDDAALHRLQSEMELLQRKEKDCEMEIELCKSQRMVLTTQKEMLQEKASSTQPPPQPKQSDSQKPPKATAAPSKQDTSATLTKASKPIIPLHWLDEGLSVNDDSDTDEQEPPNLRAPNPSRKPPNGPDSDQDTLKSAWEFSKPPGEVIKRQSVPCNRKAFKPPESFSGGLNVFSHVLKLMGYPPLWFTASQDAYEFHLGSDTKGFYTIEMTPQDLMSFETSNIKWTVIGKPWAHPKALTTLAWPFIEDSVGYMWIEKELSWVRRAHLLSNVAK